MLNKQDDGLNAARGLFWGILLSLPIWLTLYYLF